MTTLKETFPNQTVTKLPDGPREPEWFHTIWVILRPLDWLDKMQERYGDIFLAPSLAGFPPQVLISNPQAIEEIFTADSKLLNQVQETKFYNPLLGQTHYYC